MAVKLGVPIEKLESLSALLAPAVAEGILDAYWKKNGDNPKLYTVDLAARFLSIAREIKCLREGDSDHRRKPRAKPIRRLAAEHNAGRGDDQICSGDHD
jgi:hypothetical protein